MKEQKATSSLAGRALCHHQRRCAGRQRTAETDEWLQCVSTHDRRQPENVARHLVSASQPATIIKPMTHVPEKGTKNRLQKSGIWLWFLARLSSKSGTSFISKL